MALTRFRSGITILTEDFVNSIYGGLYGDTAASDLDVTDPLVAGHIHDGQHLDGHAQKIDLSTCVTGQLNGANILENSIGPEKLGDFAFDGIWSNTANVTSNAPGTLASDSLVFGSSQLNDDGVAGHDTRLLFEKSTGAFRAGTVTGTQWDSRGANSVAFGGNTTVAGDYGLSSGQGHSIGSGATHAVAIGGINHSVSNSVYSGIISGNANTISGGGDQSVIIGGSSNDITGTSDNNAIISGANNTIESVVARSIILGGNGNKITDGATDAVVMGSGGYANRMGQFVIGGGTFPSDATGLEGQAQSSDFVLLGYIGSGETAIKLTLDGNAPSSTNVLIVPTRTAVTAVVDWVVFGTIASVETAFSGSMISHIIRTSGNAAQVYGDPVSFEFKVPGLNNQTAIGTTGTGTDLLCEFLTSAVTNGAVYFNFDYNTFAGGASDAAWRAVARVRWTQVRI